MTRAEIEEGAAWARRLFRKPEPTAPERKPTQAERMAAWSAQNRQDEAKGTQTRTAVEQSRRDLHVPGTAYQVGQERYAADGSRWKRTG
ncbi:hypothetical protein MMSR116_24930 [Methylobacterium mesophilicum SR1.6/6]|uniref:Uncharacterized protein n=1 Tax=Methylobacterium mesophilicum SR1.6/6 TaxID=908290 RepID=A0A6B9FUL0_9HYPH|nr:hypothetical protein [Methylobacterium mesophilicum]QGY04788.1 hypothetical protein MMSR116_24930 [Methylobacterium mesophilicum SR1.6/6]